MLKFENSKFLENEYVLSDMPKMGSLFTTGNGYMGVRGSLEEFGETKIQGAFIRGMIDEITEIVDPYPDNIYMKKYYFDEEKLKKFQYQDSCINIPDFLLIRFIIGGETFYPWNGKVLSWERYLDTSTGILYRNVLYKDNKGRKTKFGFERFASYSNEHDYYQKVTVTPVNHNEEIIVFGGIDTNVRTLGQIISKKLSTNIQEELKYEYLLGEKYKFEGFVSSKMIIDGFEIDNRGEDDGVIYEQASLSGLKSYIVYKKSHLYTSRDENYESELASYKINDFDYELERRNHINAYKNLFKMMDIKLEGDDRLDSALRFASYHTLISAEMNDSIHSLSAKALTGEKYNQFVWWDCEIYQLPDFIHTNPIAAKNAIMYRYRMLDAARKLARSQGIGRGARYPFVSSVDGDEHVWIYARHPFLQIHIMSDIAYGIWNYLDNTGDKELFERYGLEIILEISRYWLERTTKTDRGYEILNVTGTDEHHDYVNNDAYTNYLTKTILYRTSEYIKSNKTKEVMSTLRRISLTEEELKEIEDVALNMYLPMTKSGLIPQFDGYFDLSRKLEVTEGGTGKNFQMKQAGLYHLSQVIKQPDVMLLYSYVNVGDLPNFNGNWDYYENMCEASSSLTFPVHAICSARSGRMLSFMKYFEDTLYMDVKDIHNCAYQGVHAGCAAGGYLSIFKGIMGIDVKEGVIKACPKPISFFKSINLNFMVNGIRINAFMNEDGLTLKAIGKGSFSINVSGQIKNRIRKITIPYVE